MQTPSPRRPLRVLVADDDEDVRLLVCAQLRAAGFMTLEARDGEEVLTLLRAAIDDPAQRPDLILTDVKMPGVSGYGVLMALRGASWQLPVLMMSAISDASIRTVATRLGAVGVLHKPFGALALVLAVRDAMGQLDSSPDAASIPPEPSPLGPRRVL